MLDKIVRVFNRDDKILHMVFFFLILVLMRFGARQQSIVNIIIISTMVADRFDGLRNRSKHIEIG